jgi:lipoprotein-anchoring transpeptidase ErfK/SrfK
MPSIADLIRTYVVPVAPSAPPAARSSAPAPVAIPADAWRPSAPRAAGPAHPRFAAFAELDGVRAGVPLRAGAQGPAIAAVQQALLAMAFAIPAGATGSFGGQTATALTNFQAAMGLPTTGTLDAETLRALEKVAPPPGKTSWDKGVNPGPVPSPRLPKGGFARVVVGIGQHRAFLFDKAGRLQKIYGVRTGRLETPTMPGLKVVNAKIADPTEVSNQLWPDANGRAFGTKLLALTDVDPRTMKRFHGPNGGQELHGTYQDGSIGKYFSHGCVGLQNADIEEIFRAVGAGQYVRFDP